jgi:DHA2 family multidrug resistance protein
MCLGMFMAILDIQIVASSLPEIRAGLAIPRDQLGWVQTAYLMAEIVVIPLTGWLTRLLSLRGLFLIAVAGFTAASLGCAMSGNFATLLAFRVVQGFCGGAMIPCAFTAVFALFPASLHVRATAIAGALAMLAPTLGPTLGGYVTEAYRWPWLFLINLGPGIVVGITAAATLRTEKPDRKALGRLDGASLVLLAIALSSFELLLRQAPERGWTAPLVLILFALCLGGGAIVVWRCLTRARPLLDLSLLRERGFAAACFYSFVLGGGLYGSVYLLPVFLGFVRQHDALETGEIMIVTGAAQLLTAPVAAILERRIDARLLTGVGYALFSAGLLANGFSTSTTDFDGLLAPQILRGVGVMFCLLPTTAIALEFRQGERLADASGLFNLMRNLGGAVWIALIDTILHMRAPVHVDAIVARLQAGDPDTARFVGLPFDRFHNVPLAPIDEATKAFVRPLIERAGFAAACNDAWLCLGIFFVLSLAVLPLLCRKAGER